MNKQADEPRVISHEGINWLLRGTGAASNPGLLEHYSRCGYSGNDGAAFYPMPIFRCMVEQAGQLLYPNLPADRQLVEIGKLITDGFVNTPAGMFWQAKALLRSVEKSLSLLLLYYRTMPGTKCSIIRHDIHHYTIQLTGLAQQPEVQLGNYIRIIEVIGGYNVAASYQQTGEGEYIITLKWLNYLHKVEAW